MSERSLRPDPHLARLRDELVRRQGHFSPRDLFAESIGMIRNHRDADLSARTGPFSEYVQRDVIAPAYDAWDGGFETIAFDTLVDLGVLVQDVQDGSDQSRSYRLADPWSPSAADVVRDVPDDALEHLVEETRTPTRDIALAARTILERYAANDTGFGVHQVTLGGELPHGYAALNLLSKAGVLVSPNGGDIAQQPIYVLDPTALGRFSNNQ